MHDPNHLAKLFLGLIPVDVRKSISAEEMSDRLVEAQKMSARAHDPLLSPDLREAARLRMTAVLQAQPRDVVRKQHDALIAKAAVALTPEHADDVPEAGEAAGRRRAAVGAGQEGEEG